MLDETILSLIDTVKNIDLKQLLQEYKFLYENDISKMFYMYPGKEINNLMVICARGYVPLLLYKREEDPEKFLKILYTINNEGKSAMDYAINRKIDVWINYFNTKDINEHEGSTLVNPIKIPKLLAKFDVKYSMNNPGIRFNKHNKIPETLYIIMYY